MTEETHPPAGWYPDPSNEAAQRYWDGSAWTEHLAPAGDGEAPSEGGTPAAMGAAFVQRAWGGRNHICVAGGIAILGIAIYRGSSVELDNTLGQLVEASPAEGIYATGIGGALLFAAGLIDRGPERDEPAP